MMLGTCIFYDMMHIFVRTELVFMCVPSTVMTEMIFSRFGDHLLLTFCQNVDQF